MKGYKEMRNVFTFVLTTVSGKETQLQVLAETPNVGIDWDYPIKPGEEVIGVDEVLNLFQWKEE